MPEKYVRRDGLPILLRHTGPTTLPQNPPKQAGGSSIVCLHDAGLQSSVFAGLLDAISETQSASAIAFDLPGHGRSGSLDSLPSVEAMAEMARWVTEWCQIERPVLVGHGMGALVALEWARTRGDELGGLALCGAGLALSTSSETIETMRQVTLGKAPRPFDPSRVAKSGGQDMMRRAYMEGIQTDPRATLVDLEASRSWSDANAGALEIGCATRIVSGDAEHPGAREEAEALAGRCAKADLSEVADAAHFLPLEQPRALAEEVLKLAEAA
ncbi:MAG: alpha/beta fold hydrolase [Myxococcota bacterium]